MCSVLVKLGTHGKGALSWEICVIGLKPFAEG